MNNEYRWKLLKLSAEDDFTKEMVDKLPLKGDIQDANLKDTVWEGRHLEGLLLNTLDFNGADFRRTSLKKTEFGGCNLAYANFHQVDMEGADLTHAKAQRASFTGTKMHRVQFRSANLTGANFTRADLFRSSFSGAALSNANFSDANLTRTDFEFANLNRVNFSGATGMLDPNEWMFKHFKFVNNHREAGWIVYKAIHRGTEYAPPTHWDVRGGNTLTEVVNPSRANECGCGINFGTMKFVDGNYGSHNIWSCLIPWRSAATIVVPYTTNGKARCSSLRLRHQLAVEEVVSIRKTEAEFHARNLNAMLPLDFT